MSPLTILNFFSAFPAAFSAQRHDVFAVGRIHAGDDAGLRVQREPGRQIVGREGHRPLAGGGNAVDEGVARAAAVNGGPVDARLGRRFGRENDGRFARQIDGLGLFAGDEKRGVGPIGMIVVDAVAGRQHEQQQGLHAGEIDIDRFGCVAGLHRAAFEQGLAVADHAEVNGGGMALLAVIRADLGGEAARAAVELNVEHAFGVRADAVGESRAADGDRLAGHRLITFRFAPALLHFVKIE